MTNQEIIAAVANIEKICLALKAMNDTTVSNAVKNINSELDKIKRLA